MKRFVLAMAAVVACGVPQAQAQEVVTPPMIEVTGEGRLSMEPEMATVRLGVVAEAVTAGQAMEMLAADLDPVLAGLVEAGVMPRDIQTGTLQLSPVYSQRDRTGPNEGPEITGYRAESLVSAVVRDMAGLGAVMDDAVELGANRFQGVSFGVSDPQASEDAALAAAVADAMRKAALMAEAAGLGLGPVIAMSEGGGGVRPMPMMAEMRMASDQSMPVAPGEIDISAQVTVRFALLVE